MSEVKDCGGSSAVRAAGAVAGPVAYRRGRRAARGAMGISVVCAALLLGSCTRRPDAMDTSLSLNVAVRSDTGRGAALRVEAPPPARVWVASVAPVRASSIEIEVPDAPQDTVLPAGPAPPLLQIDDDLKPPILRKRATLWVPPGAIARGAVESVELDVRVDQTGEVTDALWAGGSNDSILVQVATECALHMSFYPALQGGQPIPVWCRQRFDFGTRR